MDYIDINRNYINVVETLKNFNVYGQVDITHWFKDLDWVAKFDKIKLEVMQDVEDEMSEVCIVGHRLESDDERAERIARQEKYNRLCSEEILAQRERAKRNKVIKQLTDQFSTEDLEKLSF